MKGVITYSQGPSKLGATLHANFCMKGFFVPTDTR